MFAGLRKISFKLAVLAGVPVIGVLLLSLEIVQSAHERARSADAIGSIEDLAQLSTHMTAAVDALQTERALSALTLGLHEATPEDLPAEVKARAALVAQQTKTDASVQAMDTFLQGRDVARLPPRLRRDLALAERSLEAAPGQRVRLTQGKATISEVLEYYGKIDEALIDATTALTRLSNDAELLRALSSLAAVMRVQECDSRMQAVLSHAFASGDFAPGLYRYFVNLVTEQSVHVATLKSFATIDQLAAFQAAIASPASAHSAQMIQAALEATEGSLGINVDDWFETQQTKIRDLAEMKQRHTQQVLQLARGKVDESRRAVRYGESLVVGVSLVSILLALATGRGITRSVTSLLRLAEQVRKAKDFSLRAKKTSRDELGALTDAFNEMLGGIQERDQELRSHRENLEHLVAERTSALSTAYQTLQSEMVIRERLERELRLAQKLEGIGQLAAGVAHEINTPMQYIGDNVAFLTKAFASLSEYTQTTDSAVASDSAHSIAEVRELREAHAKRLKLAYLMKSAPKALQDSAAGITHVSNIVRALKSFAHVDDGEKTTGDVNQGISDTLMVAQSEYKAVASVETDLGPLPSVRCFPGRLNQVFLNLVVNAAHAIAEAGRGAEGKIRVCSRLEDDMVVITVSDNGLGIPEHIQQKVFDQFFTTKPVGKGTGQGLSLARSIVVDAHGGTLTFESQPGEGTTFRIALPVDGSAKPTPARTSSPALQPTAH